MDYKNLTKGLICWAIGILVGMAIIDSTNMHNIDKSYNYVKLDSIKVNINKKDTIIYKLNFKINNNIIKSFQINDSNIINIFKLINLNITNDSILINSSTGKITQSNNINFNHIL